MIIDLTKYEEKLFVYQKETDDGIVYVVYADTPDDVKKELKDLDKQYFDSYGLHIIEFEK